MSEQSDEVVGPNEAQVKIAEVLELRDFFKKRLELAVVGFEAETFQHRRVAQNRKSGFGPSEAQEGVLQFRTGGELDRSRDAVSPGI
jgi:hypothetical protein